MSNQKEAAERIYGRLQMATEFSGYTFNRACEELETLIDSCGWQEIGPGYTDFSAFARTLDFSPFNLEAPERKRLAKKMREAGASNRAIADAVGVSDETINRDVRATNVATGDGDIEAEETRNATNVAPHVSFNSGDSEWFTPSEYVEAARKVMGRIDLDPASTETANEIVKARRFYSAAENGLAQEWHGAIWLNPPYAQPTIELFCAKLGQEFNTGRVQCACVLVNNATETKWFQSVFAIAGAICLPAGRIKFWHPEKESTTPLQGQAVLSVGNDPELFVQVFAPFGSARSLAKMSLVA